MVSTQINKVPATASLGNGRKIILYCQSWPPIKSKQENHDLFLSGLWKVAESLNSSFCGHFNLPTKHLCYAFLRHSMSNVILNIKCHVRFPFIFSPLQY